MAKQKLFQYAAIWNPTEKQIKDDDAKAKIIVPLTTALAADDKSLSMKVIMEIPQDYKEQLEQVDICVRPF